MSRTRIWRPILTGAARSRAIAAIDEIAAALEKRGPTIGGDASLAGGDAGIALFEAYLARSRPGRGHEERAVQRLDAAVEALMSRRMPIGLYGGLSGIAFAVAHLDPFLYADGSDRNGPIDEVLLDALARRPWRGEYDLIAGLVGVGVYAIERLPDRTAKACLRSVVDRLAELARELPGGVAWPSRTVRRPFLHYDLGIAHGVPGAVALLGAAVEARTRRARGLLNRATGWLRSQRLPDGSGYPYWVKPKSRATAPARMAWCYGDPGAAAGLLAAARAIRSRELRDFALDTAHAAAKRPPEASNVVDAGLCHGAAGVAHAFNRIYQATGDRACGVAARFWFGRTLAMRRPGRGVAGFVPIVPPGSGRGAGALRGFLTGAAGIGLALLAATSEVEPAWDRVLMTSTRAP